MKGSRPHLPSPHEKGKIMIALSSRFVSLAALASAFALGCGGVVYLDKDPGGTDASAPTPSVTPTTPAPTNTTPTPPIVPPSGTCEGTPKELARIAGSSGVGIAVGNGFVAALVFDRDNPLAVVTHDVYVLPHGKGAEKIATLTTASPSLAAMGTRVFFSNGLRIDAYQTTDKTTETAYDLGSDAFAVTGNSIYVAQGENRSLPPTTRVWRQPLPGEGSQPRPAPEEVGNFVGQVTSLSALGNEWGAVLAEGKIAQGLVGQPAFVSEAPNAKGPVAVTKAGLYFHDTPTCAEAPAACNQARFAARPPAGSLTALPGHVFTYKQEEFSKIRAFFADESGFVFHGEMSTGTELRAREAVVTHSGPGGAFDQRVGDTGRAADAITADASCIYWLETDNLDPSPAASVTIVKSVKRRP